MNFAEQQMSARALTTIASGPMSVLLQYNQPTFEEFARRHGYDFVLGTASPSDRPPAWAKVVHCRELLNTYDEVLWLDADTIIVDTSRDLAGDVPGDSFQAFARPRLPSGRRLLNAGVWYLRGRRAAEFLDAVWQQEQWTHHRWWEQRAALELLGYAESGRRIADSEWANGTAWLSDEWNSLETMRGLRGCRIRHYTDRSNRYRAERMALDVARTTRVPGAVRADLMWRVRHLSDRFRFLRDVPPIKRVRNLRAKITQRLS